MNLFSPIVSFLRLVRLIEHETVDSITGDFRRLVDRLRAHADKKEQKVLGLRAQIDDLTFKHNAAAFSMVCASRQARVFDALLNPPAPPPRTTPYPEAQSSGQPANGQVDPPADVAA